MPEEIKITELPEGAILNGTEKLEAVQDYDSVQISVSQILDYIRNNISAGGNSIIAKIINLNLKNSGDTLLEWVGQNTPGNTISRSCIIIPKQGTWNGITTPGQSATQNITCTGIGNDGDTIEFGTSPNLFSGALYTKITADNTTAKVAQGWVNAVNAVADPQFVIATRAGSTMILTYAIGATFNGIQLTINNTGAITYTGAADSVGGIDNILVDITLKKSDQIITVDSQSLVTNLAFLIVDENMFQGILTGINGGPVIKSIGDWLISVLNGTGDDFYVDVYIYGDVMPELIPVP